VSQSNIATDQDNAMPDRRFPPPWSFDEANNACYIVRHHNGFVVAYVYFEDESGRRATAKLMTRDEARRIAANIAKLPELPALISDRKTIRWCSEGCKRYRFAPSATRRVTAASRAGSGRSIASLKEVAQAYASAACQGVARRPP
jgi:hypothetical protein